MSKKIDRAVSDSVRKSVKYFGRTVLVLFIGWLTMDAFHLFDSNHTLFGGLFFVAIVILVIIFGTLTANLQTIIDYENSIVKGINYLDNLSLYLEKIRSVISLSDMEIVQKTKLSANIGELNISIKRPIESIAGEIRHELREKEEEQQAILMKGYDFSKRPPRSYVFWRKKVLGIPPMTFVEYREEL